MSSDTLKSGVNVVKCMLFFFFVNPSQVEEHRSKVTFSSHQPTCNPVFKRFLAKLLKEIEKLGLV